MRPKIFRKAMLSGPLTWMTTVSGIGYIVIISGAACEDVMRAWPSWGWIISVMLLVNAVFLSWLWFRRVRKAADDGEFD
jgi:hypothetical protein